MAENPHNLIKNGSFEEWYNDSLPLYWSKTGSPTITKENSGLDRNNFDNSAAVKIVTDAANEGIQITLSNLKANTAYRIQCRAKVESSDDDTAVLDVDGESGSFIPDTTTSEGWDDLAGTFTTTAAPADITIKLMGQGDNDTVYFDNVILVEGSTTYAFAPYPLDLLPTRNINPANLIRNGSFESWSNGGYSAPDGWTFYSSGGSTITCSGAGSVNRVCGEYSAALNAQTYSTATYLSQQISPPPMRGNKKLTLSCWVKCNTANKARIRLANQYTTAVWSNYHTGSDTFELLTATIECPPIDSSNYIIAVELYVEGGASVVAYFDGACLSIGDNVPFAFSPNALDLGGEVYGDLKLLKGVGITDKDGDTKIQLEESADEDKIRFDTNGTERMIIDNTGVGIGLGGTAPTEKLDVSGNIKLAGDLKMDDDARNIKIKDNTSAALTIKEGTTPYLDFKTTDADEKINFYKDIVSNDGATVKGLPAVTDDGDAIGKGQQAGGELGGTYPNPVVLLTQGVEASMPPSGLVAGQMYFATDTKKLYRAVDATTWAEVLRGETAIRLAQLFEKAHNSLSGIGANDHHNQSHGDADHTETYLKSGAAAGGDLGGTYPNPNVVPMLGKTNLLRNPGFEDWPIGTSITTISSTETPTADAWKFYGNYAKTVERESSIVRSGYSLKCALTSNYGYAFKIAYQTIANYKEFISAGTGLYITASIYVRSTAINGTRIYIRDKDSGDNSVQYSSYISSADTWQKLTVTKQINSDATKLEIGVIHDGGPSETIYVDEAVAVVGDYSSSGLTYNPAYNIGDQTHNDQRHSPITKDQESTTTGQNTILRLASGTVYTKLAQTFTPAVTGNIKWLSISLTKNSSPTGNIWLSIYNTSSGAPTTVIANAVSDYVRTENISGTQTVNFYFPQGITLTAGTLYALVLEGDYTQSNSNNIAWVGSGSSVYANGAAYGYTSPNWNTPPSTGTAVYDFVFAEYYGGAPHTRVHSARMSSASSTSSGSFVAVSNMPLIKFNTIKYCDLLITFNSSWYHTTTGGYIFLNIDIDGTSLVSTGALALDRAVSVLEQFVSFTTVYKNLAPGAHTITLLFATNTGTVSLQGLYNNLVVQVIEQ
jgi:hypothetical protein